MTPDQMAELAARLRDAIAEHPLSPIHGYAADIAALLDRLEAAERENERLRLFCGKVLGTSRDTMSDVYGGDVQDWALDCGLLEERSVIEPCGEGCRCAEVADFPLKCCFYTPLGEACIDAAMAAEQSDEV